MSFFGRYPHVARGWRKPKVRALRGFFLLTDVLIFRSEGKGGGFGGESEGGYWREEDPRKMVLNIIMYAKSKSASYLTCYHDTC